MRTIRRRFHFNPAFNSHIWNTFSTFLVNPFISICFPIFSNDRILICLLVHVTLSAIRAIRAIRGLPGYCFTVKPILRDLLRLMLVTFCFCIIKPEHPDCPEYEEEKYKKKIRRASIECCWPFYFGFTVWCFQFLNSEVLLNIFWHLFSRICVLSLLNALIRFFLSSTTEREYMTKNKYI